MTSRSQDQSEDTPSSEYVLNYERAWTTQLIAGRTAENEASFFFPLLKPGMSLLDCGCGPGSITLGLAKAVSPGEVTGVDIGESQIETARTSAKEQGITNARFEIGNILELPFPDDTFDAVYGNAVLMHLADPVKCVREMHRVVKRGGVVGVRDLDGNAIVVAPQNDLFDAFWDLRRKVQHHRGWDYGYGPKLRQIFREAGFTNTVGSASCDSGGTLEQTRQYAGAVTSILEDIEEISIQMGWVNEKTIEETKVEFKEWGEHPDAMYASIWFETIGFKD